MIKHYCFGLHLKKAKAADFTCKNETIATISNAASETSRVLQ